MTRPGPPVRTYNLPFRAVWLRRKDLIDLRIAGVNAHPDSWTTAEVLAHVASFRLVGVTLQDHKRIGLGRWLRSQGEEAAYEPGSPLPSGTASYDEAGQLAYFSVWPLLSADADRRDYARTAKILLAPEGGIARIRFPVMNRRGRAGALGSAAGLLATR